MKNTFLNAGFLGFLIAFFRLSRFRLLLQCFLCTTYEVMRKVRVGRRDFPIKTFKHPLYEACLTEHISMPLSYLFGPTFQESNALQLDSFHKMKLLDPPL